MCDNCNDAQLQSENDALKKQVSALTHSQPYILQLKSESETYRIVIEQILLEMAYGTSRDGLPPAFVDNIVQTLRENDVCIVTNPAVRSIGIYLKPQNATGGDKPEQEQ